MARIIAAQQSDLYDVLAHVAYAIPPQTRVERAARARIAINLHFDDKQRAFLEFVLAHYVSEGVHELDQDKLTPLLRLRYQGAIAIADLGKPEHISRAFVGCQKHLYEPSQPTSG